MRSKLALTLSLLLVILPATFCYSQLAGPWPVYMHDNSHTGHTADYDAPHSTPVEIWNTNIGEGADVWHHSAEMGPVLSPDGSAVYVGKCNNQIEAYNAATGSYMWTSDCTGGVCTGPIVTEGGDIYAIWHEHGQIPDFDEPVKLWQIDPEDGSGTLVVPSDPEWAETNPTFGLGDTWMRTIVAADNRIYVAMISGDDPWEEEEVDIWLRGYNLNTGELDPEGISMGTAWISTGENKPVWGLAVDNSGGVFLSGSRYTKVPAEHHLHLSYAGLGIIADWIPDGFWVQHCIAPVVDPDGTKVYQVAREGDGQKNITTHVKHVQYVDSDWVECDGFEWSWDTEVSLALRTEGSNHWLYVGYWDNQGVGHVSKYPVVDDEGIGTASWTINLGSVNSNLPHVSIDNSGAIIVCCVDEVRCYMENASGQPEQKWVYELVNQSGTPLTAYSAAVIHGHRLYVRAIYGSFSSYDDYLIALGDLADVSDGTSIRLTGPVVTRTFSTQPAFFYIEADDRTWGIKVVPDSLTVSEGDLVTIEGTLEADSGTERYIDATSVEKVSSGTVPEALGMRNNWLGGKGIGTASGISQPAAPCTLYNLGLLVESWGEVTSVSGYHFYIKDGSALAGASGTGVKVQCYGFTPGCSVGNYVQVVGISSMESGYRVLRVNNSDGVDVKTPESASTQLSAGWNLIGLAKVPVNPDPEQVFQSIDNWTPDGKLIRRDACTQSLITYDGWEEPPGKTFGNMLYGEGYWLKGIPQTDTLLYSGVVVSGNDQWISVPKTGWKYWGDPFTSAVQWQNLLVTDGRETLTMRQASDAQWLSSIAYWWNAPTQGLKTIGLPEDWPDSEATVPWHGYQQQSYVDGLALIIPNP